jgi:hypothetical protein
MTKVMMLAATLDSNYIGRDYWRDRGEYERMRSMGSLYICVSIPRSNITNA